MRRATPNEAQAVSDLLQRCGQDIQERLGLLNWSIPYPLPLIQQEIGRGEVWVLEENGSFIATFTLDFDLPSEYQPEWFAEPRAPAAYLHRLGVDPTIQGRGLGAHCLNEVERVARQAGRMYLRFDAYRRNAGIQTFYQKQGFTPLREFQMLMHGHPDTFTLYEKKL